MFKRLLYRFFGVGKLPKKIAPVLDQEGIFILDEGIGGAVTLRNFRAPGRRHSLKHSAFIGSIVVTRRRFAAFAFSRAVINVPLDDPRLSKLNCSVETDNRLVVSFPADTFHKDWSGGVTCRFSTEMARQIVAHLQNGEG